MPCPHHSVNGDRQEQRDISALGDLGEIGKEEGAVDDKKEACDCAGCQQAPAPDLAHRNEKQRRRDQHRQRNGDAVGGCQIVGFAEPDGQPDGDDHQQPVDDANIDLPVALR